MSDVKSMSTSKAHSIASFEVELCRALSLEPSRVYAIDLHVQAGSIPTAVVTFYAAEPDGSQLTQRFELLPIEDEGK